MKLFLYLFEYHFMRLIAKILGWPLEPLPKLNRDQKKTLNKAVKSLLEKWKIVIKNFPRSREVSPPFIHLKRFQLILLDLKTFLVRKGKQDSHDIKKVLYSADCPDYFKRNYHFQTDGYFTRESAARYDHQIELLFLGVGHIMRKVAYSFVAPIMKENASVLEFGAASGTSGHQFKLLYPKTDLDILEPGKGYLDYAKETYPNDFKEIFCGFMEHFKSSKKYDLIFSCFVMHEIPFEHWDAVIHSIKQGLKEGGHLLIIDAQQDNDRKEHQFALDQFAQDFYEPYFPEYRKNGLENFLTQRGFKMLEKNEVLFSKALLFSYSGV